MTPETASLIDLLHTCSHASLATHSRDLPGYPYLSVLPFVPDEHHCPLLLISGLAEHTRNLNVDARASLLLFDAGAPDLQAGARLALMGRILPFEPGPEQVERYLRYLPSAERLLRLADFRFVRMRPERLRFIGGFGRMGWLDGEALASQPALSLARERELLAAWSPRLPDTNRLLGIDRWGLDVSVAGTRHRVRLPSPPVADATLPRALDAALNAAGCLSSPTDSG